MSTGNFFSVELESFHAACELGMNEACLYLVMAMGTDRKGIKTSWSCNALQTRTSITKRKAKAAQQSLLGSGLIRQTKQGKHPHFEFVLQGDSEKVFLPSEFIDGAADEIPPLELMRQGGDVMALRLLVDLYSVTNFADDGGVQTDIVFFGYKSEKLSEVGEFAIWGFDQEQENVYSLRPAICCHVLGDATRDLRLKEFGPRLKAIQDLGLARFVPVLFDSDGGEIMHHLENPFTGESMVENAKWAAANLVENRLHFDCSDEHDLVLPILKHFRSPVVKGVLALKYRQKTQLTAAGYQITQERWQFYQTMYEHLQAECSYQGYIKGISKVHQG